MGRGRAGGPKRRIPRAYRSGPCRDTAGRFSTAVVPAFHRCKRRGSTAVRSKTHSEPYFDRTFTVPKGGFRSVRNAHSAREAKRNASRFVHPATVLFLYFVCTQSGGFDTYRAVCGLYFDCNERRVSLQFAPCITRVLPVSKGGVSARFATHIVTGHERGSDAMSGYQLPGSVSPADLARQRAEYARVLAHPGPVEQVGPPSSPLFP